MHTAAQTLAVLLLCIAPAGATVPDSVTVDFLTPDRTEGGQPVKIAATIAATSERRIASGPLTWAGTLAPGEKVTLDYVAVPVSGDVLPLSARVLEGGQPEETVTLQFIPPAARAPKKAQRPRATTVTRTVSGRIAFMRAGEPVQGTQFRFVPTAGWKMEGPADWTLAMKRGETRELAARATPMGEDAGPLEGEVLAPGSTLRY